MYIFYELTFALSLALSILYVLIWNKHYDINISAIFILIPIANIGYLFSSIAINANEATIANKIIYLGGCFLTFFITMSVWNLCNIKVNRYIRFLLFALSSFMYILVLTIGYRDYYYKDFYLDETTGQFVKVYGIGHSFFIALVLGYMIIGVTTIVYTLFKKKQASKTVTILLFIPEFLAFVGYFGNTLFGRKIDVMPLTYVLAQIVYLLIVRRMALYNTSEMVVESMVRTGDTGFINIDFKNHYLGSNETAQNILPELKELRVDDSIDKVEKLRKNLNHWIDHFKNNETKTNIYIPEELRNTENERMYAIDINFLHDGFRKRGYQIFLKDDTDNQKYIKLLDAYNEELQIEVDKQTNHIVEMHDNLIMSMAMMVESRDNSTGGHIRRTSEGVRILIDEIKKGNDLELSDEFCKCIIKAAPMHDIGKIAVDDVILRKPGRFNDEEFEKMKIHSAEGARIVHEILKETDDEAFKKIAENVAHFHHERWDGSGYPDRLKGEEIPLEARIMAIADVYDALVSKRVYKESMSFEEADRIIMEGMGTQFDAKLKPYYIKARPRFEAYYSAQDI
ncbi:N-terminal 7TM region of histidine kinase [Lachnospiraceae bacterium G41]|nr:N-terminal 7TM region of histidine kinase [Lachnospiraceae bacterium G41]